MHDARSPRPSVLVLAVLILAGAGARPASAQPLPADARQRVDAVFASFGKQGSPGCAVAVYHGGEIAYAHGYGMASLELGVPISPQTVFDIGSTSKQFTAFSILLLEREGKLSLDDDVRKFLPRLPSYQRPITIRHLMNHTSGLRDYLTLWSLAGEKTESWTTQQEAVDLVLRQRGANFGAGDDWLYSNTGYLLLAEVVEKASGKNLKEFAAERIFAPLGMTHTFYLNEHRRVVPLRATAYSPASNGAFEVDMSNYEQIGDGAVQTTVEDLLLWDRNFYSPKVGDTALIKRAQEVGKLNSGKVLDYAAGLRVASYRGVRTVRHGGAWAGYRAELLRFPDQQTSVACLCNLGSSNPSRLADQVADVVLDKTLEPTKAELKPTADRASRPGWFVMTAEQLAALAGIYRSADGGEYRRLVIRNGKLLLAGQDLALSPVSADRLEVAPTGAQVIVTSPKDPGVTELQFMPGPGSAAKPAVFRRLPPVSVEMREYVGRFYSDELDTTYTFATRDGQLVLLVRRDPAETLFVATPDVFIHDSGLVIEFQREAGKVRVARVQAGRVRNLEFKRVDQE